jgi:Flp pilus assembly protein TadG
MTLKTLKLNKYLKYFRENNHKWCRRPDCGQSSVEFVLVLPLLIIIVLAVSQLGFCTYLKNVLEHAASEAARVVSTTNSENLAREQVYDICSNLDAENLNFSINPSSGAERNTGDFFTVKLSYKNAGIFNFISKVLKRDLLIESTCVMRMECKS